MDNLNQYEVCCYDGCGQAATSDDTAYEDNGYLTEPFKTTGVKTKFPDWVKNQQPPINYNFYPPEPKITNKEGGKQSDIPYAFHLCPADAMLAIAETFYKGAKEYEKDNWRKIPCEEHINHAIAHLYKYMNDGNIVDLEHAMVRTIMAYSTEE